MKRIKVNALTKTYNVNIGSELNEEIAKFVTKHPFGENVFVIADSKAFGLHKEKISTLVKSFPGKSLIYKFVAKEKNKNYIEVQKLQARLLKAGFGRDTLLLAIGGGITGDVAGFASATYMRGIPFVQIPTTVLAAVDSSVGGKTGINFENGKNIIGAFYQPEAVFIDKVFFKTLPETELISGLGEIVKYSYLAGGKFFEFVKNSIEKYFALDEKVLTKLISDSVKIKSAVVESDEKETGLRKILNLGHTFAHALEIEQQHKINHGAAVLVGLAAALKLSADLGLLSAEKFEELILTLTYVKNKIKLSSPVAGNVYRLMFKDKKKQKGEIKFVLLGDAGIVYPEMAAPKNIVIKSLKFAFEYF